MVSELEVGLETDARLPFGPDISDTGVCFPFSVGVLGNLFEDWRGRDAAVGVDACIASAASSSARWLAKVFCDNNIFLTPGVILSLSPARLTAVSLVVFKESLLSHTHLLQQYLVACLGRRFVHLEDCPYPSPRDTSQFCFVASPIALL